jgi:hypothetical protein
MAAAALALVAGLAMISSTVPADAVNVAHGSVVSADPAGFTPHVMNGRVNVLLVMGSRVIVGGTFTQVRASTGSTNIARSYIFAFNATTGVIDTGFHPTLTGAVEALAPGPDGQSVYVGGSFGAVNGSTTYRRLARLTLSNGQVATAFRPNPNQFVFDLLVRGNRLYAGGQFTSIGGAARSGLALLDQTSGVADPALNIPFTDPQLDGKLVVWRFDVTPDGSKMIAAGDFTNVGGLPRTQIAMLNVGTSPATVASWQTDFFTLMNPSDPTRSWCASIFPHYIRDLDISPDGSYVAIVTTGANAPLHPSCDSITRWEMGATGPGQQPTWIANSGGDSFHSVLATGAAIYAGGHQQYVNNPYNPVRCGRCTNPFPGGISRIGFSAHDPLNGLPFSWDPVRNPRGKGVLAMVSTPAGFFFGSDTDNIAQETHRKLAFMPLAGGTALPSNATYTLPGYLYTVSQTGSAGSLVRRSFDGATFGPSSPISSGVNWADARGAFALNGRLYTGWSNGTLTVRSFNGSVAGSPSTINLYGLENAPNAMFTIPGTSQPIPGLSTHLTSMTGMTFDNGWVYYTVAGDPRLYSRAFTQESLAVGAPLLVASTGDGVDWASVRGMTLSSGTLYFALSDGTLNRVAWANGHPAGAVTTIGGPSIDGTNWASNGLFVFNA